MSKAERKMSPEELQGFLHFRKRGYYTKSKKGKGSYQRHNKYRKDYEDD